jgi:hypothetical protein
MLNVGSRTLDADGRSYNQRLTFYPRIPSTNRSSIRFFAPQSITYADPGAFISNLGILTSTGCPSSVSPMNAPSATLSDPIT